MDAKLVLMCFTILFVAMDFFLFFRCFLQGCGLEEGMAYVNFEA